MSGELVFLVNPMFFSYITWKSILVHVRVVQGRIQEFLIGGRGGGGGGAPNIAEFRKDCWNFFVANYL